MSSRLRQPTEQELRDLAMTLAGEIDQRRSPISRPETRVEAANILATVVNRFSTDEPMRFGRSQVRNYSDYSDVVRNAGQYNAWMGAHVPTTQRNYDANKDFWDSTVRDFFSGELQPTAPNATHYHADFITPQWSRSIDRVAQAGPHIFYNDEAFMGRPLGGHRPSYAMAPPQASPSREGLPDPQRDLNPQELASIAPPVPATPQQLKAVRASPAPSPGTPINERTIGGYIGQGEVVMGPNTQPLETLSPGARDMVKHVQERSGLPSLTINHGFRSDADHRRLQAAGLRPATRSQHRTGNALDFSVAGLPSSDAARMLDAAIYGGAREIGASPITGSTGLLHAGLPRNPDAPGNGFRSWGYPRDGRGAAPWVNESSNYRDLQRGRQYFRQGTPTPRPDNLEAPQSSFPARPATPSGLPGAPTLPQRAETTPRPSERYSNPISSNGPPSSFPSRPSMGQGGMPAARPSGGIDAMRAQAQQTLQSTQRPQMGPFPVSNGPRPAPQVRSPTDFQYETRTRQVPNPAYRAPTRAPSAPASPNQATPLTSYFSNMSGADYRSPTPAAPQEPEFITERYQVQVPGPVQTSQFGHVPNPTAAPRKVPNPMARPNPVVPNPMARPGHFGPNVGPIASPRSRTRARQVPNPVSAPRQQGGLLQAFSGFNDWAGGMIGGVNNTLNQFAGPAAQQRFTSQPTRYAGGVVLPPQPTSSRQSKSSGGTGKPSGFPTGNGKKSNGKSPSRKSKSGVGGYYSGGQGGGFTW